MKYLAYERAILRRRLLGNDVFTSVDLDKARSIASVSNLDWDRVTFAQIKKKIEIEKDIEATASIRGDE